MDDLRMVPIDQCIAQDEFNTRQRGLGDLADLTESIKAIGVKEPLLGKDKENSAGEVEIYAGFRRLAASKDAGLEEVPVMVCKRRSASRKQMLLVNVTENIQREDLNPVDEAYALQRLQVDHKMSIDDICASLGVKRTRVQSRFKLLKLTEIVRDAVHDDKIPVAAALEIDRLPADKQAKFVDIAEELGGGKLRVMIDKELDKLQLQIEGTEKKKKDPPDTSSVNEALKTIKKSSAVVGEGIGYDKDAIAALKAVKFRVLDPDDVVVVAKFFDDTADLVPDEVAMNDKAQEEIISVVESCGSSMRKIFDVESPTFRTSLKRAIAERAQEIAQEKAAESGKRPKVTYAIAREAIDEFFTSDGLEEQDGPEIDAGEDTEENED